MKQFEIKAQESVNGVEFGASRQEARESFGTEFREIKKSPLSKNTMDAYKTFHVFYTPDNLLEAVEIFPESTVMLNGQEIPSQYADAKAWFMGEDASAEANADSVTSRSLGISIYAPEGKIESILVAKSAYFDF